LFHKINGSDQADRSRKPISGALEAVTHLHAAGHELYLISFAGRKTAAITLGDMHEHFPNLFTGIYIVKDKLKKVAICHHLGIDVMVDDTIDVHHAIKHGLYPGRARAIAGIPSTLRILFTPDTDGSEPRTCDDECHSVTCTSWQEVYEHCSGLKNTHTALPDMEIKRYVYPEFCSRKQ
jgi:hypothetical protein